MAWSRNQSCVKANSMNLTVRYGVGIRGPYCLNVAPCMYIMYGL